MTDYEAWREEMFTRGYEDELAVLADDVCPNGGGHEWAETGEAVRGGRRVQVLRCSCGAESVGYL